MEQLMIKAKVNNLLALPRIDLLIMGNLRQCSESRAEAIMSAMGAMDWHNEYLDRTGKAPPEDNLVLDTFPLAFVREAERKIGGPFFYVNRSAPMKMSRFPGLLTRQSIGSMLPFSGSLNRGSITAMTSRTGVDEDHDSVSSWTIQTNGCVHIRRAGILAPKRGTPTSPIPASIVSNKGYKASFVEAGLQTWLDQQPRGFLPFAVVCSVTKHASVGSFSKTVAFGLLIVSICCGREHLLRLKQIFRLRKA
jgi:hypothetical protein